MNKERQTFSFVNGIKICELYEILDFWGKFLFFNSVRKHEVAHQAKGVADGSAVGRPIVDQVCRTQFQGPSCEGCKMLIYHRRVQLAEK